MTLITAYPQIFTRFACRRFVLVICENLCNLRMKNWAGSLPAWMALILFQRRHHGLDLGDA
ncbi:MAG: hypothetical protein AAB217_27475, partial [Chloroflexota bacterium]